MESATPDIFFDEETGRFMADQNEAIECLYMDRSIVDVIYLDLVDKDDL